LIDRGNSTYETPVYLNVTLGEVNADGKEVKAPRTVPASIAAAVALAGATAIYFMDFGLERESNSRDYGGYSRVG